MPTTFSRISSRCRRLTTIPKSDGVVAFFLAHVAFIAGFLIRGLSLRRAAAAAIPMVVAAVGSRPGAGYGLIALGAVIFFVFDIFVARGKFVAPGSINTVICYPLYYSACLLLAHSVRIHQPKGG